jgi:hypothetical protein
MAVETINYKIMLEANNASGTLQMLADNISSLIIAAEIVIHPKHLQSKVIEIVKQQVASYNLYELNINEPLLTYGSGASHIYIANAFNLRERHILIQFENNYL